MKLVFILTVVSLMGAALGNPRVSLRDATTIEVSWPTAWGKQYGLFYSPDLVNWSGLGGRRDGIGGRLSATQDRAGRAQGFYRIEEFNDYLVDPSRFMFGTVGNKWIYNVTKDDLFGVELFVWETEMVGRTIFNGENVIEWSFLRNGLWDQSIYLRDDFSAGIYEVGGAHSVQGAQTNSPPLPSFVAHFTPGESMAISTTSSVLGQQNEIFTITIEKDPLTVGAGTFTGLFKVVHDYTGTSQGIAISGTTTEWFALEVGLVKHVGDLNVLGSVFTTTFELSSYELN
jgi:hypothetical protein